MKLKRGLGKREDEEVGDKVVGEIDGGMNVGAEVGDLELLVGAAVGVLVGFVLLVGGKLLIGAAVGVLVGGLLLIKDVGIAVGVLEGGNFTVGTAVGACLLAYNKSIQWLVNTLT